MKKFLKPVKGAEGENNKLEDTLDAIKDDFDYVMAGIDKLGRSGAEAANNALIIAESFQSDIQSVIEKIAQYI